MESAERRYEFRDLLEFKSMIDDLFYPLMDSWHAVHRHCPIQNNVVELSWALLPPLWKALLTRSHTLYNGDADKRTVNILNHIGNYHFPTSRNWMWYFCSAF